MRYKRRRVTGVLLIVVAIAIAIFWPSSLGQVPSTSTESIPAQPTTTTSASRLATDVLATLAVKGRAPKTDYKRVQFGDGWILVGSCDMRNIILNRDLSNPIVGSGCKVASGTLADPYTGKTIQFERGPNSSSLIQIDHVVALSNAWQTGAQQLTVAQRIAFANDPLELLAVDGDANQAKGDGDAATWLPTNKAFRCQYVARQIAVKAKYQLWVTAGEHDAMVRVLQNCPEQTVPGLS
jgi:hypothetical protein